MRPLSITSSAATRTSARLRRGKGSSAVGAFKEIADRRAEPLLLETLRAGPAELRAAALGALSARWGRGSFEPLYAFSKDRSLSRSLRDAARSGQRRDSEPAGRDCGWPPLARRGETGVADAGGPSLAEENRHGALREFSDPRIEPLALEALAAGDRETKLAAAHCLNVCGSRAALEPLYAVFADRSQPQALRETAEEAAAAVRERLGKSEAGLLSLSGGEARQGGLSPAEDGGGTGSGCLSPVEGKPDAGDSPSPRKH